MTKYPKVVWIVDCNETLSTVSKGTRGAKRYHLHPGNEVKLKRENAAMRKWIIRENGGKRSVKQCPCLRCKKLREVVADW